MTERPFVLLIWSLEVSLPVQGRPCGPAATPRSRGTGLTLQSRWNDTHHAIRKDRTDKGLGQPPPSGSGQLPTQAVHHRRTATDNSMPGRSLAAFSPAQARGLGSLLRHDILSPVGMLPGLGSPWATLISELPVHACDLLLGLGHCLRRPDDLLPQSLALRLRLLGSLEDIGAVGVTVRHDRTGTPSRPSSITAPDGSLGAARGHIPSERQGQQRSRAVGQYPQLSSSLRSAPQVLGPPRFSLARRKSPGSQSIVGR
jgi:hypothetical protein